MNNRGIKMSDSPTTASPTAYEVLIIGGGQAGLAVSYYLQQAGIQHVVLEQALELCAAWRHARWDNFTLVTPNWQCRMPAHPYQGPEPDGFMHKQQIIDYLDGFIAKYPPPVVLGATVRRLTKTQQGFVIDSSQGGFVAQQVVVATGAYHQPIYPPMSSALPEHVQLLHSAQYRNATQLADGNVLVIGSGQSGAQIAEDLHLAGRKVYLSTGEAPRCARFYRGKDVVKWLYEMGYYQTTVTDHRDHQAVRHSANHYVTGRDGGRDIDLRKFALEGMQLFGRFRDYAEGYCHFAADLQHNLDQADATYNRINASIDDYIAQQQLNCPEPASVYQALWQPQQERRALDLLAENIRTVICCIGFRADFSWLQHQVFDQHGTPCHQRGVSGDPDLSFIGLPWLHTWGSGRFLDVAQDAEFLVQHILQRRQQGHNLTVERAPVC
jgi:putative flavoprotein involved in K+ transport